jgi:hypothetical protein
MRVSLMALSCMRREWPTLGGGWADCSFRTEWLPPLRPAMKTQFVRDGSYALFWSVVISPLFHIQSPELALLKEAEKRLYIYPSRRNHSNVPLPA